jgi:hypothetical protein
LLSPESIGIVEGPLIHLLVSLGVDVGVLGNGGWYRVGLDFDH